MQESPLSTMSNIMQVREYMQSPQFPYSMAFDLNTRQVLFYVNGGLVGDELKEKVDQLSNKEYPHDDDKPFDRV